MKRDMNPISLLEFNHNARVDKDDIKKGWIPAYTKDQAGSTNPFVGTPYIEFVLTNPSFTGNNTVYKGQRASLRLKFLNDEKKHREDDVLYRSHHGLAEIDINKSKGEIRYA